MNHRILFGSYPIPRFAGIVSHNFVVWTDEKAGRSTKSMVVPRMPMGVSIIVRFVGR